MKVLDLFAGLRGWSDAWRERGHEVFTVDFDQQFDVDLHKDILRMTRRDLPWLPDVILASPPCEGFSVMTIRKNWGGHADHLPPEEWIVPKTDTARMGLKLVERTREIIIGCQPRFFIIENPRGKLRKLPIVADLERRTVTYCHYGERRMKPTDLWGGFPPSLTLEPACKNGDQCHVRAPRGSKTGTQGMGTYAEKAKVPHALALAVCLAAEIDILEEE